MDFLKQSIDWAKGEVLLDFFTDHPNTSLRILLTNPVYKAEIIYFAGPAQEIH